MYGSRRHATGARRHGARPRRLAPLFALVLGMSLALLAILPVGPASALIPVASAHANHAVLVRSEPAANAILRTPPSRVRLWFSEALNAGASRASAVDPQNRELDKRDSQVSSSDPRQMTVSLPVLPAGAYIVVWHAQSTDDGHVTSGTFVFRIARPDGSVPPPPPGYSGGQMPGGAGAGLLSSLDLDGPAVAQALATWLALLALTFWVGGLIWETWVLAPGTSRDPDLAWASVAAARRFRRLAPYALGLVLVADVGIVLAQSAELAGDWSEAFAPSLLKAILLGSRFGAFWWMRQVVALAALGLPPAVRRIGGPMRRRAPLSSGYRAAVETPVTALAAPSTYGRAVSETAREILRGIPRVPGCLVSGWVGRTWLGRLELLLGGALLVAFALSGHAAAVPARELGYAVSVDVLHLLGNVAWGWSRRSLR